MINIATPHLILTLAFLHDPAWREQLTVQYRPSFQGTSDLDNVNQCERLYRSVFNKN